MEYCFYGNITLDDFIQFNKSYIKKSFWGKLIKILFFGLIGILLVIIIVPITIIQSKGGVGFYSFIGINNHNIIKYIIILFCLIVSLIIFIIIFNKIIMPSIYKKYYDSNKMYNELQNYKINEHEIRISSESNNVNLVKEKILKVIYDKDSIYIFIGLNMAYIIKARFLKNINEFNELKELINVKYCNK